MGNDRSATETKQAESNQPAMTDDQRIRASRESRSLSFAIPTKEADLVPFVLNFARTIASDPQRFITDPHHARELLELAEEYDAAYRSTRDRETTPPCAITRKMALRAHIVKAVRKRAQWIKAQPSISVEDKVAIGFVV